MTSDLHETIEALSQAYLSALLTVTSEAVPREVLATHRSEQPSSLHRALAFLEHTVDPPLLSTPLEPKLTDSLLSMPPPEYLSPRRYHTTNSFQAYSTGSLSPSSPMRAKNGMSFSSAPKGTVSFQKIQCFKTKPCRFWLDGRCTRGDACTFAHANTEMRDKPDLTKTKICAKWRINQCPKSSHDCLYAHGVEELRQVSSVPSQYPSLFPSQAGSGLLGKHESTCSESPLSHRDALLAPTSAGGDDTSPSSTCNTAPSKSLSRGSLQLDQIAASIVAMNS